MNSHFLGIDTGGTFTDFVYLHGQQFSVHKVLSTPAAPQDAIVQGIKDMGLTGLVAEGKLKIVHGTTVATNATLEGKGVPTVYIANKGLSDVLTIGRQTRPELYNLVVKKTALDLPEEYRLEVSARLDSSGIEISGFQPGELKKLKLTVEQLQPEAIAINLLFSFVSDEHEKQIEALFGPEYFVSRSSYVLPEYREYERGIATWVNAWIGPLIDEYLLSVQKSMLPSTVSIMQSSGVSISADQAAKRAVNLLLSGPVGGLQAAQLISGSKHLITFDMGGTSTDVALIDGDITLTNESQIANIPIAVPMADIHTIGAGGGSIAYIDDGGLLQVGPASAGANPGPACYGLGGKQPTVTDANLLLQRLQAGNFLGGKMKLDLDAASEALRPLAEQLELEIESLAMGIVQIANEHMIQALRVISVERGFDPRDFTLVCFGGAGGLHFCDLAEALEMTRAIVPVNSGVLSALGMLAANPGREIIRTHRHLISETNNKEIQSLFVQLQKEAEAELESEGVIDTCTRRSLDLRYFGQTFTLTTNYESLVQAESDFHQLHEHRYGHRLEKPVELLNLRLHVEAPDNPVVLPSWKHKEKHKEKQNGIAEGGKDRPQSRSSSERKTSKDGIPVIARDQLVVGERFEGPALVTEAHATTLVNKNWNVSVDTIGNLMLEAT
jgi:N-methylhydantoinase A